MDIGLKGCFLFSQYDNFTTAQDHLGAIEYDPHRFLYHWNEPAHRERLKIAASQPEGYKIYANVFQENWERLTSDRLKERVRRYARSLEWKPRNDEAVETNFEVQFGELFIRMKYGKREAKIKFEEIEKFT